MTIPSQSEPFSLTMLIMHRRQKREGVERFIASSMYVRILSEILKSGQANRGEAWIYCDQDDRLEYEGVTVRLVSDFNTARLDPESLLFVRGDKKRYLKFLQSTTPKRCLFYGASTRGIPRYSTRYHGILVDDPHQVSGVKRYYPQAYIGIFLKTAIPETFVPLPGEPKEYDICIVGSMNVGPKNFHSLAGLAQALPEMRFVVCGHVDQETIDILGGRSDQITRTGYLPSEQLNVMLNRSRLGLLSSDHTDASPRVILEFMAAGLPILANKDACGIGKYVLGGAGRIAGTDCFGSIIPEMLSQKDSYDPRRVFEEHFSPARVACDFVRHIQAVLAMPDKPPSPSWRGRMARVLRSRLDNESNV